MAEPNFRLESDKDEAVEPVDFALNADEVDAATAGQPILKLPVSVGLPEFEQMIGQTKERLIADGFDPDEVETLVTPFSLDRGVPESMDLNDVYKKMVPVFEENHHAIEETWKINSQIEADGVTLGPFEWSAMRRMIAVYGKENIQGMAEARTWWQRAHRAVGDSFAQAVSSTVVDFNLGLALLDVFSYGNKKMKLQFVPKDQRRELEDLVLPKITLENGKSFNLGTSAAWSVLNQIAWSGVERASGSVMRDVGSLFGSNTLKEIGEITNQRGIQRNDDASGQVPGLVSALGPRLSWQEVVERNWDPVADIDSMYESFDDMGLYGDLAMGGIALGDGIAEIVADPFLILGSTTSKIPAVGRAAAKKFVPSKAAQITSDVARRTDRFEDAVDAVSAAKAHVAKVDKVAADQAAATGGQISMENAKKKLLARRQLIQEERFLDKKSDAGANTLIQRTARRNPEMLPKTRVEQAYLEPNIAKGTSKAGDLTIEHGAASHQVPKTRIVPRASDDLADELRAVRRAELEREMDSPIDWDSVDNLEVRTQRSLFGPDDAEQGGDALNLMTRTGGIGIDDVATTNTAPEIKLVPDSQTSLINWRAIDQANQTTKAERQFLSTSGARQFDLGFSTQRSLARQLDIVKRNLGHARTNKDKAAIKLYTQEMKGLKSTMASVKGGLSKRAQVFDDAWLPPSEPGITQNPARFNRWLNVAGDRVMRSLYPGGFGLTALGDTRAAQIGAPLREPQRFYDQYDPAAWDRIRSGYNRFNRQTRSFYEDIINKSQEAGIMTEKSKFNPSKDFSPFDINQRKNTLLYDLLDTPRKTDEFAALALQADEKMMKLHDSVRATLDHSKKVFGLSDEVETLSDHMRHVMTKSQFAGGARPMEYVGLPGKADTYASHILSGDFGGRPRDAMLALDLYGRAMNRRLIVEPIYDDIIKTGSELAAKHNNPMFQTYSRDFVDQLQGKPRMVGQKIDQAIGGAINKDGKVLWRPGAIDRVLIGTAGLVWSSALPGNPRYPIMQIASGAVTTSSRFGLFRTSKALWQMATREGQAVNKQLGTYDDFLNIFESDFMRRWSSFVAKRGYTVTPFGIMSTGQTEEYIRGVTGLAAIDLHMTKLGISSWGEAKELGVANRIAFEALRSSEEVNHMFGALGRSPWASRTLSPLDGLAVGATQFLSFMPKQTEELVSQFNRDPGMIAQYLAASGWISRMAAEEMGIDVTNYVGLGYAPEMPDQITSPMMDASIKFIDFLYQATPAGTIQGRSDSATALAGALDNILPFLVAFETAGKASQRLLTNEQNTASGERSRSLEMGSFGDEVNPANFARSIDPAETDEVGSLPGLGGDLLPTVFGQQSIRENLFRRGQKAVRRENDRYLFEMQKTTREFAQAIDDGDAGKAIELEERLLNEFNQVLLSGSAMEKAAIARELSWTLRQLDRAPDQVKARMVKIIQDFGLALEP